MHFIPLTEAFEYIADAGYVAYIEKMAQINTVGTQISEAKQDLYRKFKLQEKKFNQEGKLIGIETIHSLLFPKLSSQD
jgi:hypothetical protein